MKKSVPETKEPAKPKRLRYRRPHPRQTDQPQDAAPPLEPLPPPLSHREPLPQHHHIHVPQLAHIREPAQQEPPRLPPEPDRPEAALGPGATVDRMAATLTKMEAGISQLAAKDRMRPPSTSEPRNFYHNP